MRCRYELTPRPASLGGGWRLRLIDDHNEVGGGIFPVPSASGDDVAAWWDALDDAQRIAWLDRCADYTHAAFLTLLAYQDAEASAQAWLSSRS